MEGCFTRVFVCVCVCLLDRNTIALRPFVFSLDCDSCSVRNKNWMHEAWITAAAFTHSAHRRDERGQKRTAVWTVVLLSNVSHSLIPSNAQSRYVLNVSYFQKGHFEYRFKFEFRSILVICQTQHVCMVEKHQAHLGDEAEGISAGGWQRVCVLQFRYVLMQVELKHGGQLRQTLLPLLRQTRQVWKKLSNTHKHTNL